MLEGLINRDILSEHYDEVLEALQKYQELQLKTGGDRYTLMAQPQGL